MPTWVALLVAEKARSAGRGVSPEVLDAYMGFSYETPYLIGEHLLRLGLAVRSGQRIRLSREGEDFFSVVFAIAEEEIKAFEGIPYERALGAAIYALTDWKADFHDPESFVNYIRSIADELGRIKSVSQEAYRYALMLILMYPFDSGRRLRELLCEVLESAPSR